MNKQDIPAPAMANGWRSSFATSSWRKPLLSLAALAALLPAAAVQAAVVPLQLTLPSDIGLDMDFQVEIDWTTQPAASGGSLVLVLPPALSADPLGPRSAAACPGTRSPASSRRAPATAP